VLIGLIVGIVAVIASQWFVARPRPVVEVRELSTVWGNASLAELGKLLIPSTQPDPVAKRLDAPLESFAFHEKTLDEGIALLAGRVGCNFYLDWHSLEAAGATRGDRFSFDIKNATASVALKQMLATYMNNVRLAYRVEEGIVRISTADGLSHDTVVRVYDVRDLVQEQLDREHQGPPDVPRARVDSEGGNSIAKVITSSIDPASWRDAGGSSGSVEYFAGRLIINQTPENHDAINQLLAAMRRKQH
jgi:hypothetical protein